MLNVALEHLRRVDEQLKAFLPAYPLDLPQPVEGFSISGIAAHAPYGIRRVKQEAALPEHAQCLAQVVGPCAGRPAVIGKGHHVYIVVWWMNEIIQTIFCFWVTLKFCSKC